MELFWRYYVFLMSRGFREICRISGKHIALALAVSHNKRKK